MVSPKIDNKNKSKQQFLYNKYKSKFLYFKSCLYQKNRGYKVMTL